MQKDGYGENEVEEIIREGENGDIILVKAVCL